MLIIMVEEFIAQKVTLTGAPNTAAAVVGVCNYC